MILNISLAACATLESAGTVTVLGPWTDETAKDFERELASFEADTGIDVIYRGTSALNQDLLADVKKGTQPDIAMLFSLGELAQYQRDKVVHPLDDVIESKSDAYIEQWPKLQNLGTDKPYAVVVKVNFKSIIWFNPTHFTDPPQTWDDLVARSQIIAETNGKPWCSGMGSTPSTGWPGTDLIEDIMLHQFGIEIYQQWVSGELSWMSQQVRQSWINWGEIMAFAGYKSALLTDFGDAGHPLFTNPPGCFLLHHPSFTIGGYLDYLDEIGATPQPDVPFDFFPFPKFGSQGSDSDSNAWVVSADFAAMFNKTPQAEKLIQYLATEEGQKIWPKIVKSGSLSAHKDVDRSDYGNDVSRGIADKLTSAKTLCYDAADLMPATMRNAFQRAVLEYLSDPSQLDSLLMKLEQVRLKLADDSWLHGACGE
ncbi:MAG: ABC transporter substrate-binding protein [Actinobacteria bacterium]|nr:ABC transporter substrate-binding protein [Actinomycetota bacterium]